jgi:hypothetical protein
VAEVARWLLSPIMKFLDTSMCSALIQGPCKMTTPCLSCWSSRFRAWPRSHSLSEITGCPLGKMWNFLSIFLVPFPGWRSRFHSEMCVLIKQYESPGLAV